MSTATAPASTPALGANSSETEAAPPQTLPEWSEPDIITALARLESLQDQLDSLRLTMPIIVRCLVAEHSSPEVFANDFRRVSLKTQTKLVVMKRDWESKETKDIFEHCRSSGEKKVDWGVVREVPVYGYVEEAEKVRKRKFDEIEGEEDEGKVLDKERMEKVLVDYRANHEDLEAELGEDSESIKIKFKTTENLPLSFLIQRKIKDNRASYDVQGPTCKETDQATFKLFNAIDRSLAKRSRPNDLEYTLEMIAAYKDLETTKCDTCGRLLDSRGMTPTARKSKKAKGADGVESLKWVSVHESCL